MIKKFKIAIVFLLLLCVVIIGTCFAFAGETKVIINAPGDMPKAGESFKVIVDINGNAGISVAQFILAYDKTMMICTKATVGEALNGSFSTTNEAGTDGAIIAAASTNSMTADGSLGIFEFTALKDIEKYNFMLRNAILKSSNGDDESFDIIGKVYYENSGREKEESDNVVLSLSDIGNHWANEYIEKAAIKGLFKGNSDGSFKPDDSITRAQFVTVLYRMSGSIDDSDASVPFTDTVNLMSEYQNAIAWAYSKGYVKGTSKTTFSPNEALTRQEAIKILHYYNNGGISGMELMFSDEYEKSYSDSRNIADWAKPSVYWGVYKGLISGNSDGTMAPERAATRAQLAKILIDYMEKLI